MHERAVSQHHSTAAAVEPRPWQAAYALGHRELVRFFRQRNRVIGAIGQPVMFWLLFGAGLDQSFRLSQAGGTAGQSFREYYVPGTLALIVLFTAIFATISIIEDRREGFLQSVLVAPIPSWAMVIGKVAGGSLIALAQAALFLVLAAVVEGISSPGALLHVLAMLLASAIGLTGLGFVLAWRMDSTQGFHAVMSVLLMPMWLLSGAFFPVPVLSGDAGWAQWILYGIMRINPLTYAVAGVRQLLAGPDIAASLQLPSLLTCWIVTVGFALAMLTLSARATRIRIQGDLQ
ncbi:MAG TPA: multidrug ABC transporter permease [Planctomycetaceae bacterium]|nr:multidrug ABC transporter permease [Planctomycetaceae bacterium]